MDYAQFVLFIKPILFFDFCAIMLYYKNSHGQNEVNQVKKQTLVPLITFLLGICLVSLIVYKTDTHEKEQRHITAQLQLQKFTKLPKSFSYHGKEHAFYISLGYAEYPTFASNRSQLMRYADAALYEIKLHGKNGCMVYREGLRSGARKQLGFAFKDISEHLPGAFIIYRADKEDDELFFANDEFLHMSGYKDIDELFRLTEKSFRNLIREDEQQQIESSIWEQIDNGNENDYIHFHLRKADGTYFSVLDHGRIVESPQYGKVFYVLFMDWEDMHIRYNDKFAR
ncbi:MULTISPECIES: PAS domain-containing protein [Blautia]|uniref:PAS domain-containing protein n=1 Tax=Blautia TaxID=572511 RepID=UPI0002FE66B4|nr:MULTISPECIES: PAS domain-containing protein [Blautia]